MYNVFDYLKWRGDLLFSQAPINEVDNIIFSRLSSLPLHKIEIQEKETLSNALKKIVQVDDKEFLLQDKKLCKELINIERYKNLKLSDFQRNIDVTIEQQFAAVVIWISENEIYISYNGTDESFVGWKEDFNMSFMQNIPSQLAGVLYLQKIANKYLKPKIYLGGHSKGGNIAVYSGIHCDSEIKGRIVDIFSADGPGFDKQIIETEEYKKIVNKINTYIPQSSIIGRLLEHDEEYNVVKSNEKGIMQHDIYSWEVLGTKLVRSEEMTKHSQLVNDIVRNWLKNTTPEQRKNFINILYELLVSTNATKFSDLKINVMKNVTTIINAYKNTDQKQKDELHQMVMLFLASTKNSLIKELPKTKK